VDRIPSAPPGAVGDHEADRKSHLTVALVGNPNAGKTTIFNNLTGARQHVGNYPGVTVEHKEGVRVHGGRRLKIVDLPGTYSLTAYSEDELVARDFVIDAHPDVIVHVVDASNLERNLYLGVQLLELGVPLVIALNMSDVAAARGYAIDRSRLSALLGDVPLVPTVGHRNEGTGDLLEAIVAVGSGAHPVRRVPISYGREVDEEVGKLAGLLEGSAWRLAPREPRWIALKLLEGDGRVRDRVRQRCERAEEILSAAEASVRHLEGVFGDSPEVVIADRRYGFISGACQEAVRRTIESRHEMSDRVDAVLTHPILGLPIFLALMYGVFWATFRLGEWPMRWIEGGLGHLAALVAGFWPAGEAGALKSLVADGILGGVGSVIVFLPNILILFLAIALLEDTGYMARAAFITDRWMHRIGLHGKSFIPMLIGFGCTVPAILATRVLESRRDRLVTMFVLPLISCGARLPIYAMLIPAFFPPGWRAPMLWMIYLVGVLAAALLAKGLRVTVFRGEATPFVMELPPYRMPTLRSAAIHMWERGWMYLRKAGTLILGVSMVMWALTSYPKPPPAPAGSEAGAPPGAARRAAELEHSVAGRIGKALEPVTRPLGFDWRMNTALVGAFVAKEVFVAQMGIVFALGEDAGAKEESAEPLRRRLRETYTPLQGLSVMLFCLLGFPCMATVAVMRAESGRWKWTLLQWGGLTALAYAVCLAVYQIGGTIGLGT
jgi:ferrous iron transport protein B